MNLHQLKLQKVGHLACTLYHGISPLDAITHEKILRTSFSVMRADNHQEAVGFFREHFSDLKAGLEKADKDEFAYNAKSSFQAIKQAAKYEKGMCICLRSGHTGIAIQYAGMIMFVLHNVCVPYYAPHQMILAGDLIDKFLSKRYSPLSCQRAKSGSLRFVSLHHCIEEAEQALTLSKFFSSRCEKRKHDLAILTSTITYAERLSAGYMIYLYDTYFSSNDTIESEFLDATPRPIDENTYRKDSPDTAPESGHADPSQTQPVSQTETARKHRPDDPSSAPESGDLD